jgi:hypothetical protein
VYSGEHTPVSCLEHVWRQQACQAYTHAEAHGPFGTIRYNRLSNPIERKRESNLLGPNKVNCQVQFSFVAVTEYTFDCIFGEVFDSRSKSDSLYFISTLMVSIRNVVRSTASRLNAVSDSSSMLLRSVSVKAVDPNLCVGSSHSVSKRQAPLQASGDITQPPKHFVKTTICRNNDHEMFNLKTVKAKAPIKSEICFAHTVGDSGYDKDKLYSS